MLKKLKKGIVIALIFSSLYASASAAELSSWAKNDYLDANYIQIIPFSVGSKSMNQAITREELCELIVNTYKKLSKKDVPFYAENPFADCDNQVVINAYGVGLVGGTGEGTFNPDGAVTREEMAKMIYNMLAATNLDIKFSTKDDRVLNKYNDSSAISDWARPAVATMINHSLMNGVDGNISPKDFATREQAIIAVSRAYKAFNTSETLMKGKEVIIINPLEQNTIDNADVPVSWNPVIGAASYRVILRNSNGEVLSVNETWDVSYIIPKHMFLEGEYHITVSATFEDGKEIFSLPVSFNYINSEWRAYFEAQAQIRAKAQAYIDQMEAVGLENLSDFDFGPEFNSPVTESQSPLVESIFAEAEKHLGTPYVYGGTTPAGFDCSGFVQYVFKQNGINLTRTSRSQYASDGRNIPKDQLRRGDLVFFGSNGTVGHVGIYAGDGQMIHSPSTGKSIMYTSIESNYYVTHYMGAKRIIE